MVLTVHHLGISQSERIVWLCEELGIDYKLVTHTRAPILAPESLKIPGNALGKAPFIEDSDTGVALAESGAICEYIINKHGNGRLAMGPNDDPKKYADYLYWFHYSNSTLQPALQIAMFFGLAGIDNGASIKGMVDGRLHSALQQMDDRLKENKWLVGDEFTAADVMSVYPLTTQRYYGGASLAAYKNILRYLQDVGKREVYQRAIEKGDPEMKPLLEADGPEKSIIAAGGVESDIWKKK
ncbi:hypothetical protein LTR17_010389 [Elasticomyces elasticus]|nr:hypothetical protein LTR17_010389 [Elasticomyces elasticus]